MQEEIARRTKMYKHEQCGTGRYPFTGLIVCSHCGRRYRRKTRANGYTWICPTYNSAGKSECPSKQIPEKTLIELTADIDLGTVKQMVAEDGNILRVCFKDGTERVLRWQDRSRAESWTEEMKQAARETAMKGGKSSAKR